MTTRLYTSAKASEQQIKNTLLAARATTAGEINTAYHGFITTAPHQGGHVVQFDKHAALHGTVTLNTQGNAPHEINFTGKNTAAELKQALHNTATPVTTAPARPKV